MCKNRIEKELTDEKSVSSLFESWKVFPKRRHQALISSVFHDIVKKSVWSDYSRSPNERLF